MKGQDRYTIQIMYYLAKTLPGKIEGVKSSSPLYLEFYLNPEKRTTQKDSKFS